MNKDLLITTADSLLCANRGLLSPEQETRLTELLAQARETEEEDPLPLELLRLVKVLELKVRDSGPDVNSFILAGQPMWFTPYLRANLRNAVDALQDASEETVSFKGLTMPIAMAKAALSAIELYAAKSENVTEAHAAAIMDLESAEDIERYDITVGYPDRPEFQF